MYSSTVSKQKKKTTHTHDLTMTSIQTVCCTSIAYDFYLKQLSLLRVWVLGQLCACAPKLEPIIMRCSLRIIEKDSKRYSLFFDSWLSMSLNWFASLGLITMRFLAHLLCYF